MSQPVRQKTQNNRGIASSEVGSSVRAIETWNQKAQMSVETVRTNGSAEPIRTMVAKGRAKGLSNRRGHTMLDAYIIDAIRREEEAQKEERGRVQLEIPLHREPPRRREREATEMGDPVVIPLYPEGDAEDTAA